MSVNRAIHKLLGYQVGGTAATMSYGNNAVTSANVQQALDWIFAALYPNTKPSVANTAALPASGNTLNDYRVSMDDGDGKAAGYRWEKREGEAVASWHKIHDMDWSTDAILAAFTDITNDQYVHKMGREDLDASGNPVSGMYAGQKIFGGVSPGENLTLNANSGDGVGAQSGYVQSDNTIRPTSDATLDLGTTTQRFHDLFLSRNIGDGTVVVTVQNIKDAFTHSQIISGNPHGVDYATLSTKLGVVTLVGDLTGSMDLSTAGAKTLNAQVVDDSHNHTTSTITDFTNAHYLKTKAELQNSTEVTWTFDDTLKTATPNVSITSVNNIDSPAANRILAGNAAGTRWSSTNATVELTGGVTGSSTFNSTTGKWSIAASVAQALVANLQDVNLTNKVFTIATGNPATVTMTAHGLQTGEAIRLFGSVTTPSINNISYVVTKVDANTFTIPVNVTAVTSGGYILPQGGQLLYDPPTGKWHVANDFEEIMLGELSGLNQDVLSIYVAIAGRSGGQTIQGGISASENLTLESTSNVTKGSILVKDKVTPNVDAAYSAGWTGTDLGSSAKRFNDVYMAGEAKGLRIENLGSLPSSSGTKIGRLFTYNSKFYWDNGSVIAEVGNADINVVSKVANYTVAVADGIVICNGTFTLALPTAVGISGKTLRAKNIGTGVVTIDPNASETIDGALTYDLINQYQSIGFVSDGANWHIL
jgi:hypothetical protein